MFCIVKIYHELLHLLNLWLARSKTGHVSRNTDRKCILHVTPSTSRGMLEPTTTYMAELVCIAAPRNEAATPCMHETLQNEKKKQL